MLKQYRQSRIDVYYMNPQILKTSKKFNIWNFNNTYHPIKSPGITVICCDVGSVYVLYPDAKTKQNNRLSRVCITNLTNGKFKINEVPDFVSMT